MIVLQWVFPVSLAVLAIVHLISCWRGDDDLRKPTKVALMPVVALAYLAFARMPSLWVVAGLLFGCLGDLFLLWPLKKKFFVLGTSSFFLGHVCYLIFIYTHYVVRISWIWILALCRVKIHVTGLEKVPTDTEYLFVSNHRSNFDPMVQWWVLRRWRLAFVSKPSNMRKFVIGPFVRRCCFLPIDRENARNALTTINAAADLIRAHTCSFAIYPEGTRSKSGELLPWHAGSLKIAQKTNVPIVVATIEGTERIAHNVPWRRTHVYLRIREVIPAETVKATKTNDLTKGIRCKMLAELGK